MTSEEFNLKLKSVNPNIYSQCKCVEYKGYNIKTRFESEYGDLLVAPENVLRWKELSLRAAINTDDFWVKRSKSLRSGDDNIDYTNSHFINNKTKIELRCKIHNYKYTQRPSHHTAGVQGCPYCATQTIMYTQDNLESYKVFFKNMKAYLYVLLLQIDTETFYKVGITKKDRFDYRMNQYKKQFKKYEILYKSLGDLTEMFHLEQRFLEEF